MEHSKELKSALEASMERLKVPVVKIVSRKGEIIDGGLRAEIAATTGATVYEHVLESVTPLDRYRLNFAGLREVNAGQKAMIVVTDAAAMESVSNLTRGEQDDELAAAAGVTATYIRYARRILKDWSERVPEVLSGEAALHAVNQQLKDRASARGASGTNKKDGADERDMRETPPIVCEAVREVFGGSNFLDAASHRNAKGKNPVGADRIYTEDDDALHRAWEPRTWCNFPFSKKKSFLAKAVWEAHKGNASYCLGPDGMSTKAMHFALRHATDVLVIKGRLDFAKPDGTSEKRPNFGSLVFGFGRSAQPLADALRKRGVWCTVLVNGDQHFKLLSEVDRLRQRLADLEARSALNESEAA